MTIPLVMPILIPLFAGAVLLVVRQAGANVQVYVSAVGWACTAWVVGSLAVDSVTTDVMTYGVGGWPMPFGIALACDRLTVLMLTLSTFLGIVAFVCGRTSLSERGTAGHALLQFQIMGVNGAFLTADLFNLFVFFEVLLMASYALLLKSASRDALRAATRYVVVNLLASTVFLIAVGVLYATLGTLNLADLALRIRAASDAQHTLIATSVLLLLLVFFVKAALLPLHAWLPSTYASTSSAVRVVFALLTKVGVYATMRIDALWLEGADGSWANVVTPWLLAFGFVTMVVAGFGMLAAERLRVLTAYAIILSSGTLIAMVGVLPPEAWASTLYYLAHSTLVAAGFFLVSDWVAIERGAWGDSVRGGVQNVGITPGTSAYFVGAIALAGLPPLSGFIGKALMLESAVGRPYGALAWSLILLSSLAALMALSRAGSRMFWKPNYSEQAPGKDDPRGDDVPAARIESRIALAMIATAIAALTVFASPVHEYLRGAASQLSKSDRYIESVMQTEARR